MSASDDIPRAAASFHCMVDRSSAFTLDHVAVVVGNLLDQQLFIEIVRQRCVDGGEAFLTEALAIFQDVAANQLESVLVVALALGIELGVAPISSVFAKHPIEREVGGGRG
jgi:hypothetical protein